MPERWTAPFLVVVLAVGFVAVATGLLKPNDGETLAFLLITGLGMGLFGYVAWRDGHKRTRS